MTSAGEVHEWIQKGAAYCTCNQVCVVQVQVYLYSNDNLHIHTIASC
jgi:hypothetical protein